MLSSMIEGTQSSLADLLLFEQDQQPGVPMEDAREVSLYVAALEHGLKRLRGGFPLSLRLMREVHKVLLGHGRGARHTPGGFRRSQVWIGGTRPGNAAFVPPPANALAIHRSLQRQPIATAASLVATTGLTPATVNKSLVHLERLGVVAELTRKQRGRVFSYARYADILNEGMELPDGGGRR